MRRLLLMIGLLLAACGNIQAKNRPDGGGVRPDAGVGADAGTSACVFGDKFGGCVFAP
jgi:hypothetical protein